MFLSIFSHCVFFFFNDTAPTEIYTRPYTLSLHDALPIFVLAPEHPLAGRLVAGGPHERSEEHTSELQSHGLISYAVFCLKKKKTLITNDDNYVSDATYTLFDDVAPQ